MADITNEVRGAVLSGLSDIPEVGGLVAALVGLFWPQSEEDIWGEIKKETEAMINKALDTTMYDLIKADLKGLETNLRGYADALRDSGSPTDISQAFMTAVGNFNAASERFRTEGYEVLLLPLFVQMANLHLALLRDGVVFGAEWGWATPFVADKQQELTDKISDYTAYVAGTVAPYLVLRHTDHDTWQKLNDRRTQFIFTVTDPAFFWPYFDPQKHLKGAVVGRPDREVYVLLSLDSESQSGINIDTTLRPRLIYLSAYGWDRVDRFKQTFEGEPAGPFMGDDGGGSVEKYGWEGPVTADNPIIGVTWVYGDSGQVTYALVSMQFRFRKTGLTNEIGGHYGSQHAGTHTAGFPEHILSKVYSPSGQAPNTPDFATAVVVGFRFEASYDSATAA